MSLDKIRDALLTVGVPVDHYEAMQRPDKYIVWTEDGVKAHYADGRASEIAWTGTVDYFTKAEEDPNIELIWQALEAVCACALNSVQYEDGTNYIHYEFTFEVA